MRQTLWAFLALISHWRRHPGNFCALFIGLALATALWSGVQAINGQARESYARAAALFTKGGARSLVAPHGGAFPQELYVRLRLAGWKVSPVLEGSMRIGDRSLRLVGIEPLTAPRGAALGEAADAGGLDGFLKGAGLTVLSPHTLRELNAREGETPPNERGQKLPPLRIMAGAPPGVLIVDIGRAQELLDRRELLSRLVMDATGDAAAPRLDSLVGDALRFVDPGEAPDLAKLTDSFHLNLTAFGLLAFLVGLFIAHAAHGLAFEQRAPMIRTLRSCGVSVRALAQAMLVELAMLGLTAGGVGLIGGYAIAAALLPNVAASLEGLYGAQVEGELAFEPQWAILGLGVALLGALAAAAGGLVEILHLPILQAARPIARRRSMRGRAILAAFAFAAAGAALLLGESLAAGFAAIAGLLLGAILLFPLLLSGALRLGESFAQGPIAQWFWADCRLQTPALSLALTALLLALATNIGVGAMVEGFRATFVGWLDERLIAEVYFEAANDAEARRIEAYLRSRPEVAAILPGWKAASRLSGQPIEAIGLRAHETYRAHFPLLFSERDAWDRVASGEAALISEQLARRLNLGLGATIDVPTPTGSWRLRVVGVYPDYGNPKGQLRVDIDALARHWPDVRRVGYGLRVAPEAAPKLIADLQETFGAGLVRILDQAAVKALSLRIFEHTFAVTAALNLLTLLVSGVALLSALTTLGNMRVAQLAPVWAIGVTRRRLSALELARILLLSAATALAALPLGLALAWTLVAVINVRAFGWRLPFHLFPGQWGQVFLLAVAAGLFSALVPTLRLARASPAALLKAFDNER